MKKIKTILTLASFISIFGLAFAAKQSDPTLNNNNEDFLKILDERKNQNIVCNFIHSQYFEALSIIQENNNETKTENESKNFVEIASNDYKIEFFKIKNKIFIENLEKIVDENSIIQIPKKNHAETPIKHHCDNDSMEIYPTNGKSYLLKIKHN